MGLGSVRLGKAAAGAGLGLRVRWVGGHVGRGERGTRRQRSNGRKSSGHRGENEEWGARPTEMGRVGISGNRVVCWVREAGCSTGGRGARGYWERGLRGNEARARR